MEDDSDSKYSRGTSISMLTTVVQDSEVLQPPVMLMRSPIAALQSSHLTVVRTTQPGDITTWRLRFNASSRCGLQCYRQHNYYEWQRERRVVGSRPVSCCSNHSIPQTWSIRRRASIISPRAVTVDNEASTSRYSDVSRRIFIHFCQVSLLARRFFIPLLSPRPLNRVLKRLYDSPFQRYSTLLYCTAATTFGGTTNVIISSDGGEGETVDIIIPAVARDSDRIHKRSGEASVPRTSKVTARPLMSDGLPNTLKSTSACTSQVICRWTERIDDCQHLVGTVIGGVVVLLGLVMSGVLLLKEG